MLIETIDQAKNKIHKSRPSDYITPLINPCISKL